MFSYTDTILFIMKRVQVYNEIFASVTKEIDEYSGQKTNRRGRDTYLFCRNNVNRFLIEEESFRKSLSSYEDKAATQLLLEGLDAYKTGIYFWIQSLNETCAIIDEKNYRCGLVGKETSFKLINQACKAACEGIESAHSVHKM